MSTGEIKVIPAKISVTVNLTVDLQNIPAEQLEKDPVGLFSQWAKEFKAEMENDPVIGPYVRVSVSIISEGMKK